MYRPRLQIGPNTTSPVSVADDWCVRWTSPFRAKRVVAARALLPAGGPHVTSVARRSMGATRSAWLRVALRAATKATEQALDRGRVVHLTTIRDAHDEDGEAVVLDLVEDPILAHLEAPDALPTGARQQLGALWSRFGRKAIDRFDHPGARVAR